LTGFFVIVWLMSRNRMAIWGQSCHLQGWAFIAIFVVYTTNYL